MTFDELCEINGIRLGRERAVARVFHVAGKCEGMEESAMIAEEMEFTPPTRWGEGVKFNAIKIKLAIRKAKEGIE